MTVKEIFELRKQGKIEEAYEAIKPMYAEHKGKYTTLCMFWTASDILKKRVEEKKTAEAVKIFEALLRVLPGIDDNDGKAHTAILSHVLRLSDGAQEFSILNFLQKYGVDKFNDDDWKGETSQDGHALPSTAQRILTRCFHVIKNQPDADHAIIAMPLLQEAMRRNPRNKNNQRYMAVIYYILGEKDKALNIYQNLIKRYRDCYLFAELAELTDEPGKKAALLCKAIINQRQENFCMPYRIALAKVLLRQDNTDDAKAKSRMEKAAFEINKCIEIRNALGYHNTREINELIRQLKDVKPNTQAQQTKFYQQMVEKFL